MANCFICQTELAPPMRAPHTVYVRKLFLVGRSDLLSHVFDLLNIALKVWLPDHDRR